MELVHVVGARPQFIKMGAVSRAIARWNAEKDTEQWIQEKVVHTGQHYDYEMSRVFFEELAISEPTYNLDVGSDNHGAQTGVMLKPIFYS